MPSTPEPSALRVDAGEHGGEPVQLSGTYYPAADGLGAARPLLVCLPGGTYNHRYWDLEVDGHPGYSFARDFAARGHDVHLVERADHLGGQLALAATAPERGEWAHLVEDLAGALDGVRVSLGTEADAALLADEVPDAVVLATGSAPGRPSWPPRGRTTPGTPSR